MLVKVKIINFDSWDFYDNFNKKNFCLNCHKKCVKFVHFSKQNGSFIFLQEKARKSESVNEYCYYRKYI